MNLWYTARGAGLAALVLLSLSTCLGALVSRTPATARAGNLSARYLGQYLHRTLAALGLVVICVHVGTLVADSYAHVGLTGALIPFASGYRPLWVTLGLAAAYLFVIVGVLGFARGRMASTVRGARRWRAVHCLAYLGWASAVVHGLTSGTDTSLTWVRLLYIACITAVAASVAVRLSGVLRSAGSDRFSADTQPLPAVPARIGATR